MKKSIMTKEVGKTHLPELWPLMLFLLVLFLHLLQLGLFWQRLPDKMSFQFDLLGEPNYYCSKKVFLPLWIIFLSALSSALFLAHSSVPLLLSSIVIFCLLLMMQMVIHANIRSGRLPIHGFLAIVAVLITATVFLSKGA